MDFGYLFGLIPMALVFGYIAYLYRLAKEQETMDRLQVWLDYDKKH